MKIRRELSGIYFRSFNNDTKFYENVVFEDLTEEEQNEVLTGRNIEWLKSLCKQLANTINEIGNEFDLITKSEEE